MYRSLNNFHVISTDSYEFVDRASIRVKRMIYFKITYLYRGLDLAECNDNTDCNKIKYTFKKNCIFLKRFSVQIHHWFFSLYFISVETKVEAPI